MWFVFAAASALCFGLRGILYHWTSQRPIERNLLLFGVYLSGTLIAAGANLFAGQPWTAGVWAGIGMGLFSFIANASMYKGYAVGKASLVALLTALPPVVVVIVAYLLWDEALNAGQWGAFAVIVAGLILVRYSGDIKLNRLGGAQWGLLAMLFFGFTDLASKQATLLGAATLPALTVMYGTGTALFGSLWLAEAAKKQRKARQAAEARQLVRVAAADAPAIARQQPCDGGESAILPVEDKTAAETEAVDCNRQEGDGDPQGGRARWSVSRTIAWGMIVGISNIGGMMFVMPAFRLGITGLVSAIVAMNVVFVLLYARLVLKETMTRREALGLACALGGVILLRLTA